MRRLPHGTKEVYAPTICPYCLRLVLARGVPFERLAAPVCQHCDKPRHEPPKFNAYPKDGAAVIGCEQRVTDEMMGS